ncbi:NAD(P)/FAD-dependent oxidoreductase [Aristophania vespae]|uniref:NAD(P)/FAD-dependent oxidoreductase n=1 Tax=Aristophania vespae TaxID=2697033 RepID=UPI0023511EB5|nr:tryptophan 7-halogenase [Aristophania vespae]UMM63952.1 hypothetical protein DM15PD_09320 [Aristophania vespae]
MVYDVAIIGAGLAGLSLARQMSLELGDVSVCLIHDKSFPNPLAVHKVGESAVEIGSHYLRESLHLKDYLQNKHIVKMGLRILHTDSDGVSYKEMGIEGTPYHEAYQMDRGLLENDLYELVKNKVVIHENHRFINVEKKDGLHHIVALDQNSEQKLIKARWMVDASGRRRCLAKKFNFKTEFPLTHSAVWFRVDGFVDLNNFYVSDSSENVFKGFNRSHSTVHLMGRGYWVWLIPLAGGKTSIGIVFDENIHNARDLINQEKAFLWLKSNQLGLYNELMSKKYAVLDFKYFRRYTYVSDEFISHDNWAVIGEAKAFIDPLYSNGTDFIAYENTMVCNTIAAYLRGEETKRYIDLYNDFLSSMITSFVSCHYNSYAGFDSWYYLYAKTNMDAIFYFAYHCVIFMNNKLNELDFLCDSLKIFSPLQESFHKFLNYVKSEDFKLCQKKAKDFIPLGPSIEAMMNRDIICENNNNESVMKLLRDNLYVFERLVERVMKGEDFENIFYPPQASSCFEDEPSEVANWRYGAFYPSPPLEAAQ